MIKVFMLEIDASARAAQMLKHAVAITVMSLMSACAIDANRGAIPRDSVTAPLPQTSAADEIMSELMRFQAMPAAELTANREAAREAFERDPAPFRRLRYLLALYASPITAADDDRLIALVEPLLTANNTNNTIATNAATTTMAMTIQQAATSRKRLREEITATRNRATNAANAANSRRDDREPEIRALKNKVEDLEKQLAALKSIERSVTRR